MFTQATRIHQPCPENDFGDTSPEGKFFDKLPDIIRVVNTLPCPFAPVFRAHPRGVLNKNNNVYGVYIYTAYAFIIIIFIFITGGVCRVCVSPVQHSYTRFVYAQHMNAVNNKHVYARRILCVFVNVSI